MNHAVLLRTLGFVAVISSSCSVLIDTTTRQCESSKDCDALGFDGEICIDKVCQAREADADWDCLTNIQLPIAEQKDEVALHIMVVDVITTKPPENMHAEICPKLDVDCDRPLSGSSYVGDDGRLVVTVPPGFDGYIEITAPSITPALFFVTRPVWQDVDYRHVLPVVSPEGFQGIAQAIGTTLDLNSLGHIYAFAADCGRNPAAGVHFEVDRTTATTASYYMINEVPVASASSTDPSGSGGFLNLTGGFTRITARVSRSGARIGESGFIVRPGAVSYPLVLPSP